MCYKLRGMAMIVGGVAKGASDTVNGTNVTWLLRFLLNNI